MDFRKSLRSEHAALKMPRDLPRGASLKEVIDVAGQITGKKIPTEIGPRRPGDPDRLISEPRKAMNELGWKPQYGDIKVILDHAWKWHTGRTRK